MILLILQIKILEVRHPTEKNENERGKDQARYQLVLGHYLVLVPLPFRLFRQLIGSLILILFNPNPALKRTLPMATTLQDTILRLHAPLLNTPSTLMIIPLRLLPR
jgi:hypothetical protein